MADEPRALSLPANGLTFSALEWGPQDGRTVLLLHGFPQRSTSWSRVAEQLAAAGLHTVAVDQRGYSPGARPTEIAAYAMPALVSDVVALIAPLGGAVDLVGHDWGGVVGWQVAARYPQLVRTWTVASTPNQLALNAVLAADPAERARFGYILTLRAPGSEDALLADDAAALRALYGDCVSPSRVADDVAFFSQPGVLTAAVNWYRAMSRQDADGLPHVVVPTTYVWGSADMAFGAAAAEGTAAYVDGPYRFVALEGAGHWLPDEAADTLAETITARVLGE
jgi:pimeloyl-ACP methyl ester carboxylesterase